MCFVFNVSMPKIWEIVLLLNRDNTNSSISGSNISFIFEQNFFQAPIVIIPTTTETLILPSPPLHKEKLKTSIQTFDLETLVRPGKTRLIMALDRLGSITIAGES